MTEPSPLSVLRESVEHLRLLAEQLDDAAISRPAYPSEWTIAQVMSHLGSAAVINRKRLELAAVGQDLPDDFAPPVWDAWNSKSPREQVDDGLREDAALLDAFDAVTPEQREQWSFNFGPLSVDLPGLVAFRLNEHVVHTWDVEVASDPAATLLAAGVPVLLDGMGLIVRWTARPTAGEARAAHVVTHDPQARFAVSLTDDASSLEPVAGDGDADLRLPAEALVRLVYGRLDADHTPAFEGDASLLERLRAAFPGP